MDIVQLGRGKYSDCFVVRDAHGHVVCLKLSYYQDATIRAFARHTQHGNRDAAHEAKDKDAISVSAAMSQIARHLHGYRVSPHFVRVLCEADIRYLPLRLKPLLQQRLPLLSQQQLKYSHVTLMDLWACDMTAFLAKPKQPTDAIVRALVFHVVYTLACLQAVFPGFRHNDLSTNNVLVKKSKHARAHYAVTASGHGFSVACPYIAALSDFDFTHVPGHDILSNERVLSGKYGISTDPNPSYDTHVLLRTMYRALKHHDACPETRAFIRGLGLDATDRSDKVMPALIPRTLLTHSYFTCLRSSGTSPVDVRYAMPT